MRQGITQFTSSGHGLILSAFAVKMIAEAAEDG
jgi:hypothetical protein